MKRGTKEFYEVKDAFEKAVNGGFLGYLPSNLDEDDFSTSTFYANGQVNDAFRAFMTGYAAAKCRYRVG